MAGVLNFSSSPLFRPLSRPRVPNTRVSIKASSEFSEKPLPSTSVSTKEDPKLGFNPPSNFKPPEPKPFSIRPDKVFDILGASLALILRLGTGVLFPGMEYSASFVSESEIPPDEYILEIAGFKVKETSKVGPRPEKPIEIYEFERLNEYVDFSGYGFSWITWKPQLSILSEVLDLDVLFYPCPRNGPNFRPKVAQMGGKQQFPYMVDPNTGVAMYESDDIIKYWLGNMVIPHYTNLVSVDLFQAVDCFLISDGNVPFMLSLGLLTTLTEGFAMIGRMGKGSSYTPSKLPPKPLELWAYEASPFCKVVREVIVELELPHILRSCARGSPKRQLLYQKARHFQAPYLEDPNTGVKMFESAEIVEYLKATYALQ
ncbi:hypothetical protein CK203_073470 [Vitis vinifera]|uniref:GST N-terminal domain-containing protein n=1 Tax=Vitis vinifera TaxID=29760 RepID=A0A438EK04_VITVI|nr:hypothetical protein CK203_073470 [Vitis vinifera]